MRPGRERVERHGTRRLRARLPAPPRAKERVRQRLRAPARSTAPAPPPAGAAVPRLPPAAPRQRTKTSSRHAPAHTPDSSASARSSRLPRRSRSPARIQRQRQRRVRHRRARDSAPPPPAPPPARPHSAAGLGASSRARRGQAGARERRSESRRAERRRKPRSASPASGRAPGASRPKAASASGSRPSSRSVCPIARLDLSACARAPRAQRRPRRLIRRQRLHQLPRSCRISPSRARPRPALSRSLAPRSSRCAARSASGILADEDHLQQQRHRLHVVRPLDHEGDVDRRGRRGRLAGARDALLRLADGTLPRSLEKTGPRPRPR